VAGGWVQVPARRQPGAAGGARGEVAERALTVGGPDGDVQPGKPDRLAGGGEPVFAGQPAGDRQPGDRPDPVQPRRQHLGADQVPGRRRSAGAAPCAAGRPEPRSSPGRWRPAAARLGTGERPRRPAARPGPACCTAHPRPGPGRRGGTRPRGCAAPRRCTRDADRGRSPSAPGISRMRPGGIQHSGSRPSASNCRGCRPNRPVITRAASDTASACRAV
jgi:hypothetical protein